MPENRAGEVGKGEDDRENENEHAHDVEGRLRPLPVEAREAHLPFIDAVENQPRGPNRVIRQEENHEENAEARQVVHEREEPCGQRIDNEAEQSCRQAPRG